MHILQTHPTQICNHISPQNMMRGSVQAVLSPVDVVAASKPWELPSFCRAHHAYFNDRAQYFALIDIEDTYSLRTEGFRG